MSTSVPPASPSTERTTHGATALVVDGNATSRRFVELALGRSGNFAVEVAHDAGAALDVLKTQLVDVIVCDTELADMSGLAFHRHLRQQHRLRSVPFVFLSAEKSVETKVAAIRAGVDDYLVKPCDVAELAARTEALVTRHRAARDAARVRTFNLAGDLSVIPLPNLVGIIEMGRRSGVLSVVTSHAVGRLHFAFGKLVHAGCGTLSGAEAFYWLFREDEGHFEFTPGPPPVAALTIEESTTGLILEAARRVDSERVRAGHLASTSPRVPTTRPPPPNQELIVEASRQLDGSVKGGGLKTTRPPPANEKLEPSLAPGSMLAAQFELALRDPFSLGALELWTERTLSEWTEGQPGKDRFHVHLVADLASGVSALVALAAAPTERWVRNALGPERKVLGLTFRLRSERIIDVVLLDATCAMAFAPSLRRVPSAMILCPPHGNLHALGTGARFELEMLIDRVRPPAVVGVGNATLSQIQALRTGGSVLRCTEGDFAEGEDDLRALLIKAVRLWAAAPAGAATEPTSPERER